jgi:hypothetical protein
MVETKGVVAAEDDDMLNSFVQHHSTLRGQKRSWDHFTEDLASEVGHLAVCGGTLLHESVQGITVVIGCRRLVRGM